MRRNKTKRLRAMNCKAQSAAASLPNQAAVEVIMISLVAGLFLAYGWMILHDSRAAQIYHARDMSLLISFQRIADEHFQFLYLGTPSGTTHLGFSDLHYQFDSSYSSALYKDAEKSYLHITSPLDSSFARPSKLYFTKKAISHTFLPPPDDECTIEPKLSPSHFFYLVNQQDPWENLYLLTQQLPPSMTIVSSLPSDQTRKVYIGLVRSKNEQPRDNNGGNNAQPVYLYAPLGEEGALACVLHKKLPGSRLLSGAFSMPPDATVDYGVLIETNDFQLLAVMRALEDLVP